MSETTQITKGTVLGNLGLNIPGAILVVMIVTVCGISVQGKPVPEPLYSLTTLAVGYYFRRNGHTEKPQS